MDSHMNSITPFFLTDPFYYYNQWSKLTVVVNVLVKTQEHEFIKSDSYQCTILYPFEYLDL